MKNELMLILGGARSGKSRFAQSMAEARWDRPLYLATAEILDSEMEERVKLHREKRGPRWQHIEEPLAIAAVLRAPAIECDGILVDCLTLWLTNVLLKEGEGACEERKRELLDALRQRAKNTILVSNEVGLGIVPDNPLGRKFRDLAGWLNQAIAAEADSVVFVAAGLPLAIKGDAHL